VFYKIGFVATCCCLWLAGKRRTEVGLYRWPGLRGKREGQGVLTYEDFLWPDLKS